MTVEIGFQGLWTYKGSDASKRNPLSDLNSSGGHIHGRLSIVISGRPLRYLGYFGPDDVCFGEWVHELSAMAKALPAHDPSRHVYDEGEQGQPAFLFERKGAQVHVSIVDSEVDGKGDPSWGVQVCGLDDLVGEIQKFLIDLEVAIEKSCPGAGREWVKQRIAR